MSVSTSSPKKETIDTVHLIAERLAELQRLIA
jgi:hypothetical protein